jgi:hypothetical protein
VSTASSLEKASSQNGLLVITFISKDSSPTIELTWGETAYTQVKGKKTTPNESRCFALTSNDLFGVYSFSMPCVKLLWTFNELDNCLTITFFCVTSCFLIFDWIKLRGSHIYYRIVSVCNQPTTFLLG